MTSAGVANDSLRTARTLHEPGGANANAKHGLLFWESTYLLYQSYLPFHPFLYILITPKHGLLFWELTLLLPFLYLLIILKRKC